MSGTNVSQNFAAQFLYMFERLTEPLFLGPRGDKNAYFAMDSSMMNKKTQKMSSDIRKTLEESGIRSEMSFQVSVPAKMPNLTDIGNACRRSEIFSYFLPSHKKAADDFTDILMEQPTKEAFLNMCCVCRDNSNINARLWVHGVVSAAIRRPDTRGIRIPAFWEIMPDLFINARIRKLAQAQASIPMDARTVLPLNGGSSSMTRTGVPQVTVDASFTGRDENRENKLWYFREDLGVASHHWHWHILYAGSAPRGSRDRKGELFYYMHHSMIGRYEAERLCNGIPLTRILDVSTAPVLEEGYFPKLTSENSGQIWGGRQENTKLRNVNRRDGDRPLRVDIEDMRKWKDRIVEAIDTGMIIDAEGNRQQLTPKNGIDILGSLIENGGMSSLNPKFYGNLHNMGHVIIGFAHDPERRHNENIGPMGDEATAMKDPSFYRWHKFIDDLFDKYKQTLDPYTTEELVWSDVRVIDMDVSTDDSAKPPNTLTTHWTMSDIDLTRGLDLRRSSMNRGPVWVRVTHLNHEPFTYRIRVLNKTRLNVPVTVRIFMAPRFNEHRQRFPFDRQRTLFFEMDKISVTLNPGSNQIVRASSRSSVTIPWESSFRDLEKLLDSSGTLAPQSAICGCGWPQHLLLPRGNAEGVTFDLFVMVTNGEKDAVPHKGTLRPQCKESLSFCGALGELYPDSKPMGFPFDRVARSVKRAGSSTEAPVQFLDEFIPPESNMLTKQIRIIHENKITTRENGAPAEIPVMEPQRLPEPSGEILKPERTSRPRIRGRSGRSDTSDEDLNKFAYDTSPDRFSDD